MSTRTTLCEWCRERPWEQLYSPDGLPGHENLVCDECYSVLTDPAIEVSNYRDRIDAFVRGLDA